MSPVPGAADLERKNAYWIEFGKREERERIIKLLEEARDECGCYEVGMPICRHTPTVDETIALIKGENK